MTRLNALGIALIAGALLTGCPAGQAQKPTAENRAERQESAVERQKQVLPGSYSCSFEVGDSPVAGAQCAITGSGGAMKLTMSGGEHQLSGDLSATDAGFKLIGQYTCTTGQDCAEQVETEFFEQDAGAYHGVVALESGTLLNVVLRKQ